VPAWWSRITSRTTATRIPIRCTSRRKCCRTARARASTRSWCTRSRLRSRRSGRPTSSRIRTCSTRSPSPASAHDTGAADALIAELDKLKGNPISAHELQRAKNQFARDYIVGRESNQNKALTLVHAIVIHNDIKTADGSSTSSRTSPEDVQRVARTYFKPENRLVLTLMPWEAERRAPGRDDEAAECRNAEMQKAGMRNAGMQNARMQNARTDRRQACISAFLHSCMTLFYLACCVSVPVRRTVASEVRAPAAGGAVKFPPYQLQTLRMAAGRRGAAPRAAGRQHAAAHSRGGSSDPKGSSGWRVSAPRARSGDDDHVGAGTGGAIDFIGGAMGRRGTDLSYLNMVVMKDSFESASACCRHGAPPRSRRRRSIGSASNPVGLSVSLEDPDYVANAVFDRSSTASTRTACRRPGRRHDQATTRRSGGVPPEVLRANNAISPSSATSRRGSVREARKVFGDWERHTCPRCRSSIRRADRRSSSSTNRTPCRPKSASAHRVPRKSPDYMALTSPSGSRCEAATACIRCCARNAR